MMLNNSKLFKNKKAIFIIAPLLILIILGLIIFNPLDMIRSHRESGPNSPGLNLTVTDSNGWSREQPEPEYYNYQIKEGYTITQDRLGQSYKFVINKIGSDYIEISLPNGLTKVNSNGTKSLTAVGPKSYTLKFGDEMSFETQMTDAGSEFKFKYIK
ncbi:MAG: hypothetical protein WCQ49_01700 [Candidatus Saccharibacteria bacterium]